MELLSKDEILSIVGKFGYNKVTKWSIENYSNKLIGYLGDHLRLTIELKSCDKDLELNLFVKCMPRFDKWKAEYLEELSFFKKEYVMLSRLFDKFNGAEGTSKWRPKLLFIRSDLFVFEDVALLGYTMPSHLDTISYSGIMATVKAVAKFHAQSFIYEDKKSQDLNRSYTIWEDYSEYLQEPARGQDWRNTGRNAVIDYLKIYSKYTNEPNFSKRLEVVIPMLFEGALSLMKPSTMYRNTIVHRDLWSNNIFLKEQNDGTIHALIVDFQTVLYCSPMLDLSSLLFFNTTKSFRQKYLCEVLDLYHGVLCEELKAENIEINKIFTRADLDKAYEDSILFGITQAAIIVPIVCMSAERREELFSNPETMVQLNVVSRSDEFIKLAKEDSSYHKRVTELFDEIVERYVFSNTTYLIE